MLIIDDRELYSGYLFPSSQDKAIAQGKKALHHYLAPYISQFFKQNFTVTSVRSTPSALKGIFRSGKSRYYFKISDSGQFEYNYLKYSKEKLDSQIRRKKQKKECKTGKVCKNTCISKSKTCRGKIKNFDKKSFVAVRTSIPVGGGSSRYATAAVVILGAIALRPGLKNLVGRAIDIKIQEEVDEKNSVKKTISNAALEKKVRQAESEIKNNNYETLIAFHPQTGKEIIRKKGNKSSVNLDNFEQSRKVLAGSIVTHNHPQTFPKQDFSFSSPDVNTAMMFKLKEMRVVTPKSRYILQPPKSGWDRKFYDEVWQKAYKRNQRRLLPKMRRSVWKGKMDINQAENLYSHLIIEQTAKDTGVRYFKVSTARLDGLTTPYMPTCRPSDIGIPRAQ